MLLQVALKDHGKCSACVKVWLYLGFLSPFDLDIVIGHLSQPTGPTITLRTWSTLSGRYTKAPVGNRNGVSLAEAVHRLPKLTCH
jgi:hypothetical protein